MKGYKLQSKIILLLINFLRTFLRRSSSPLSEIKLRTIYGSANLFFSTMNSNEQMKIQLKREIERFLMKNFHILWNVIVILSL